MVIIKSRSGGRLPPVRIPEYSVPAEFFLISLDQDSTYLYAGTNGYLNPPVLVRFLKSTGAIDATLVLPAGSGSIFDIKNDSNYVYCNCGLSASKVVRVNKDDFITAVTVTSLENNSFGAIGGTANLMWFDSAENMLYVPGHNNAGNCSAVWRVGTAPFANSANLTLISLPPGATGTANGGAGAVVGDTTHVYVGIFAESTVIPFPGSLGPCPLLHKVDKASFTATNVVFTPNDTQAGMCPQLAINATHVYGFSWDGAQLLYKFPKSNIAIPTTVDLGKCTATAYADCLYLDPTKLLFQDLDSADLTSLLLSDFSTVATIRNFPATVAAFVFDSVSFYVLQNGFSQSTLIRFDR